MKKNTKHSTSISILNMLAILFLVGTAIAIIVNTVYRVRLNNANMERYNLTNYANQFMNASAFLTSESRAYAATGLQEHYDNYWDEVNVKKNREASIEGLTGIGITADERDKIDRMADISNMLVPLESRAMELAAKGDISSALSIVYGSYYNNCVAQIRLLWNQFLDMLNNRLAANTMHMNRSNNLVNVLTWLMVVATVLIQILQNRALQRLAYSDPLTGGDNYTAFREKMQNGSGVSGAGYVVSVDLKGFSTINDTCGVVKGDQVIREMSNILVDNLGHGELAAHVSGDCFVLFLHNKSQEELLDRIGMLRSNIIDLSPLLEVPHVVPVFGIRAVDSPANPENSYSDANLAKQKMDDWAGNFYAVFDAETRRQVVENQNLEDQFDTAIREHQFEMWYQPKYSPENRKLVAAEALVRWRLGDGSMIPPGKFIPLFERNGMISQLDEYTFETVCAQQRAWMDAGFDIVPISVNVSRASLYYPDIVGRYMVIAKRYGVSTECIELEITESAMDSNRNIDNLIKQFRSCGFRILMDDFGSGYSSLYNLTKKYFDNIKIDKSLVDCINTPEGDYLLESIVHLAHEFNMTVTAEGVEKENQVQFLIILSCDNIQGYYYSRPLPVPEFMRLLKKHPGAEVDISSVNGAGKT